MLGLALQEHLYGSSEFKVASKSLVRGHGASNIAATHTIRGPADLLQKKRGLDILPCNLRTFCPVTIPCHIQEKNQSAYFHHIIVPGIGVPGTPT